MWTFTTTRTTHFFWWYHYSEYLVVLNSGWSLVGIRKSLGRHLGGLEQFFFFKFFFKVSVLGQWANSLVVSSMISGSCLQVFFSVFMGFL